ncbi:MAG: GTPase [bacterium]
MSTNTKDLIQDFAEKCRKKLQDFEKTEVKCGLIGPSGSGKSSLINAIAGKKIAAVGVVETTCEAQEFTHNGIIFTDLPGCGTISWPKSSYIGKLKLHTFDCFLLITAHRFTENDVFLYRELTSLGKPCFVIRNMFDRAIIDADHDHSHSETETRKIIAADIQKNLHPTSPDKVYLTSARHPTKYDFSNLLDDISDALSGLKKARFVADMGAYSEKALKKKRKVAIDQIPIYAGLSAANGFNPIPGLDIAADITVLIQLGNEIANIYGLTSSQFEYIKRLLGPKAIPSLLAKIAQFAAKYLAKEGVIVLLRQIATRTTAKTISKWIPFVGPLISAGIGWQATFMLGEQLVDEAENLAREILEGIVNGSDLPGDDAA